MLRCHHQNDPALRWSTMIVTLMIPCPLFRSVIDKGSVCSDDPTTDAFRTSLLGQNLLSDSCAGKDLKNLKVLSFNCRLRFKTEFRNGFVSWSQNIRFFQALDTKTS